MTKQTHDKPLEVVGVFADVPSLQAAIAELETSGFPRQDISVLGNKTSLEGAFGDEFPSTEELKEETGVPVKANTAPEDVGIAQGAAIGAGTLSGVAIAAVAAGGSLITTAGLTAIAIGSIAGAGGGAFLAKMLGDRYAEEWDDQLERGGLLVWVTADTKGKEIAATYILRKHGAESIDTQPLAA